MEAAARSPPSVGAGVGVLGDAPGRDGSECRHHDLRELGSQFGYSQIVASESGRPWLLRRERSWVYGRRGSGLLRRCSGASRRTRSPWRRSHGDSENSHQYLTQSSAVISAHKNPASSRATAAATTERTCLRESKERKRADRRTWAAHARATVAGPNPSCRARIPDPTEGRC